MSLRYQIIRTAYEKPHTRAYLLPILKEAGIFTPTEWKTYKEKHPNADKANHTITKVKEKGSEISDAANEATMKFLEKYKNTPKDIVDSYNKATTQVKAFYADKKVRKEAIKSIIDSAKASPKKIKEKVIHAAKEEVHELKHAGHAIAGLFKKPPRKLNKEDKAAIKSAALYAVSATLAASGGAALVAGALGKSFLAHVTAKAMHKAVDTLLVHAETGETALHLLHAAEGVLHFLKFGAEESDEDAHQTLLLQVLADSTLDVLEGLSDTDIESIMSGKASD